MLRARNYTKAEEKYFQLKPELESKYDEEDYVVIDPETGDYFVGGNSVEAMKKARQEKPKGKLFVAQVGRIAGFIK